MNFVFLGPPGSGKGTQALRLAKALGCVHLSTGEVLRHAVKLQTELGKKAQAYMDAGDLVPDDLIVAMIDAKINRGELSTGFILDGFPRTIPQAESLNKVLTKNALALDRAILFVVGENEILSRLRGRAEIEGRADDTAEIIKNRFEVYKRQTEPVENFYREQSILVELPGEDSPDNVFAALMKLAG